MCDLNPPCNPTGPTFETIDPSTQPTLVRPFNAEKHACDQMSFYSCCLDTHEFCDVILVCKEGRAVAAHQAVIAGKSVLMENLFKW